MDEYILPKLTTVIERHLRDFTARSNARSWLISKDKGYELK
jgi:hypothetical protein